MGQPDTNAFFHPRHERTELNLGPYTWRNFSSKTRIPLFSTITGSRGYVFIPGEPCDNMLAISNVEPWPLDKSIRRLGKGLTSCHL